MAGFTNASKDVALQALATNYTFISLHTADPGLTGANEVVGGTYARVATVWPAPAASTMTGSQVTINVPASTTVTYWGLWTAASGGTFALSGQLPAPQTFGTAGTLPLTPTVNAAG